MEDAEIAGNIQQHIPVKSAISLVHEVIEMADVAITFSVLPEEADSDLNKMSQEIKASLANYCRISNLEIKEIAFGLKKINLEVVVKDDEGQQDRIEEVLKGISGVGQVDAEDMSLV
ncbi:MAG: elongation factor 1-beta [Candidatus Thermoplasmatota archaeon]|nr:elongation factor 1-beta [Candidatus Thermoplasmatota archaeon]MCL5888887.1 elongation factor 1-beta [Candidatus Thermoplasmatota archaeon]